MRDVTDVVGDLRDFDPRDAEVFSTAELLAVVAWLQIVLNERGALTPPPAPPSGESVSLVSRLAAHLKLAARVCYEHHQARYAAWDDPECPVCAEHGGAAFYAQTDALLREAAQASAPPSGGAAREKGGAAMIAAERARQQSEEGWTPEHDDEHDAGELARAAEAYLFRYDDGARATMPGMWPARWHSRYWKPSDDPVRNLVKAGALIAAEIDRLLRAAHAEAPREEEDHAE